MIGQRIAVSGQRSAVRASESLEWGAKSHFARKAFSSPTADSAQRSPRLQTAALLATAEPLNDEAIRAAEPTLGIRDRRNRPSPPKARSMRARDRLPNPGRPAESPLTTDG